MLLALFKRFADEHNNTILTVASYNKFLAEKQFIEDDKEVKEFEAEYAGQSTLVEVHDYTETQVGYYSNHYNSADGLVEYINELHPDKPYVPVSDYANDITLDLFNKILALINDKPFVAVSIRINENNSDHVDTVTYLNDFLENVREEGNIFHDCYLPAKPVVTNDDRVIDVAVYHYKHDYSDFECLYHKVTTIDDATVPALLQDAHDVIFTGCTHKPNME